MKTSLDLLLVVLAFVSVALLLYELDHPEAMGVILPVDFTIAIIFLAEYINSVRVAERKAHYALSHWYDLLSSIPVPLSPVRMFRTIRIVRMIRVMRVAKFGRIQKFLYQSRMGHVITAFLMVLFFSSISFHILEYGENPMVQSSLDALYWALATISTVGFGDVVAVTSAGKVLTVALMVAGIGIYTTLVSYLASYLVRSKSSIRRDDLMERIEEIDRKLDELLSATRKRR